MPTSFLQSKGWAILKEAQGWQSHRLAGFLGLQRDLPAGIKLLYLPELGLGLRASGFKVSGIKLKNLLTEIQEVAKREHLTLARLEFFIEFNEADTKAITQAERFLAKAGLKKSPEEMQPEYRQLIDLTLSEENLLAQMKPKGRYNVRLAQRKGVIVKQSNDVAIFYKLYAGAAKRDGFTPRSQQYFNDLMVSMGAHAQIYFAWLGRQSLASALIIFSQGRASYLYGGSSSAHRSVMAPYLLHWQIIQDAKAAGAKIYDLLAIAPGASDNHKFSGLRRFKEQFGGYSVRVLGSYDLVFDPLRYRLFVAAEKLRGRF